MLGDNTMENNERLWLPNFADLIDRLSIHQLKEVLVPEHKEKYRKEMSDICHDIDLVLGESDLEVSAKLIKTIIVLAQMNTHIWYNESKARSGESQDLKLLHLTHGLNGIRSRVGNLLLELINDLDGRDYKTDCLAAEHAQWDIEL